MDFDIAARRLEQDQKSSYSRSRASKSARSASVKARKEAQLARLKAEKRLKEKRLEQERNTLIVDRVVTSMRRVERQLGVSTVSSSMERSANKQQQSTVSIPSTTSQLFANTNLMAHGWTFKSATSIHGDGDKIALPPSILETMTSSSNDLDPWGSSGRNGGGGRPIAFRIGILNSKYAFPSSEKMKALIENVRMKIVANNEKNVLEHQQTLSNITENSNMNGAIDKGTDEQLSDDDDDDETDDNDTQMIVEAYMDELSHRYLSYTHGTVVEFTQEEDCVGLPESIARALLQPNSHSLVGEKKNDVPVRQTVDPAAAAAAIDSKETNNANDNNDNMDIDNMQHDDEGGEKTPGHPAYGLFDIPALPIEITPINSLPPGTNCTFTPTSSSIKNGFYGLKDIKVVLEQSLMRTRATLSKGDMIRTWRRGVYFDLVVSSLSPAQFGAVSCINTNLNVDIGPAEGDEADQKDENSSRKNHSKVKSSEPRTLGGGGGGRLLSEPTSSQTQPTQSTDLPNAVSTNELLVQLPPEPAEDVKEGVCNIQIRGRTPAGDSVTGRRRFDIKSTTISHLFSFASYVCEGRNPSSFRLVTRFPRRVFILSSEGDTAEEGNFSPETTLESAEIGQGQEMFMIEPK